MAGLNPRNAVSDYKPVGNGHIKVPRAKPLVADIKTARVKGKLGKKNPAGTGNSECFWPILPRETIGLAWVVQPVETDIEMIEQGRTEGFVPSKTEVVREPRLEKVRVEGRREGLGSVKLFLVAAAIGEEEVILQPLRRVWMNGKVRKDFLRDRADAGDLVSWEGDAAPDKTGRA